MQGVSTVVKKNKRVVILGGCITDVARVVRARGFQPQACGHGGEGPDQQAAVNIVTRRLVWEEKTPDFFWFRCRSGFFTSCRVIEESLIFQSHQKHCQNLVRSLNDKVFVEKLITSEAPNESI